MIFFTIGVYNSTENSFFEKLLANQIDTFCDIRQRRGVRGAKYAYVNSNKLQQKLEQLDIKYGYIPELAPTPEIRELQKSADLKNGELKSERQKLGSVFVIEYEDQILRKFDFEKLFDSLDQLGAKKVVLFCVEELPQACHRSIVANKLRDTYNYTVIDI